LTAPLSEGESVFIVRTEQLARRALDPELLPAVDADVGLSTEDGGRTQLRTRMTSHPPAPGRDRATDFVFAEPVHAFTSLDYVLNTRLATTPPLTVLVRAMWCYLPVSPLLHAASLLA
jgi:hypothetical protein